MRRFAHVIPLLVASIFTFTAITSAAEEAKPAPNEVKPTQPISGDQAKPAEKSSDPKDKPSAEGKEDKAKSKPVTTKGTIAEDCIFNYSAGTAKVMWTLPSYHMLSGTISFKELPDSTPAVRMIEITNSGPVPINGKCWKITAVEGKKQPVIEMMTKG